MTRSSRWFRGDDASSRACYGGRLEAVHDDLSQLSVAPGGLCPRAFVEHGDSAVDRLGDADAFAGDRGREGPPEALLYLADTDSRLSRDPVGDDERAIVLEQQPGRAHDPSQVSERGQLRCCHENDAVREA